MLPTARDGCFYYIFCIVDVYASSHKITFLGRQFEFGSCQIILPNYCALTQLACIELSTKTSVNAKWVMSILGTDLFLFFIFFKLKGLLYLFLRLLSGKASEGLSSPTVVKYVNMDFHLASLVLCL